MANEKRLIDANALDELAELPYVYSPVADGNPWYRADDVWACIEGEPTVDAVEVVRCKDCQMAGNHGADHEVFCDLMCAYLGNNDFCSYGKRKTENDTKCIENEVSKADFAEDLQNGSSNTLFDAISNIDWGADK